MSDQPTGAENPQEQAPGPASVQIQLNDTQATQGYANFCHVTGTPEEVVLYFGFNTQPIGATSKVNVPIHHREVLNYYAAKRLLAALHMTIQRYEATFGPIVLDPRQRRQDQNSGDGNGQGEQMPRPE